MTTAKKWRVQVAGTQGGSYWQVAEVAFLDAAGVDLSVGGTASASSIYSGAYDAAKAFDKNNGTDYRNVSGQFPAWLQYEPAAAVDAVQMRIHSSSNSAWLPRTVSDITVFAWHGDDTTPTRYDVALTSGALAVNTTAIFALTEYVPVLTKPTVRQFAFATGSPVPPFSVKSLPRAGVAVDLLHGGDGTIRGTVERKSDPLNAMLRRRVRLYNERTGQLVAQVWSDAVTGEYRFTGIDAGEKYTALAYDYEHNYRAEAADNLQPEVLP